MSEQDAMASNHCILLEVRFFFKLVLREGRFQIADDEL